METPASLNVINTCRIRLPEGPRLSIRDRLVRLLVIGSIGLLAVDTIYSTYNGITYQTRESCILYGSLPRWAFLIYENFVELLMVVIVGIFAASLLERYFSKFRRFVPKHPLTAFAYASIIPVCSCSAIPIIKTMNGRVPLRTIITFVVAAPLLNPYIIVLSFSVLGVPYGLLRIAGSLVVALSCGYAAELLCRRMDLRSAGLFGGCGSTGGCSSGGTDVFSATFAVFRKVLPFMLMAGALSLVVELAGPGGLLKGLHLDGGLFDTALVVALGVPVYFCNGADVLFLQPLLENSYIPMGPAMAFSLTSTSVCITSLALLIKYIGRKLTLVILTSIVIVTVAFSQLLRLVPLFN